MLQVFLGIAEERLHPLVEYPVRFPGNNGEKGSPSNVKVGKEPGWNPRDGVGIPVPNPWIQKVR